MRIRCNGWITLVAYAAVLVAAVVAGKTLGKLPSYGPWTSASAFVASVGIVHLIVWRVRRFKARCPKCTSDPGGGLCRAHESIRALLALVAIAAIAFGGLMLLGIVGFGA